MMEVKKKQQKTDSKSLPANYIFDDIQLLFFLIYLPK